MLARKSDLVRLALSATALACFSSASTSLRSVISRAAAKTPCSERARRQLVVGDLLFAQHELDRRFGPLRIGEVAFERRADQLVARAAGERLHLLVDVRDDARRVGGHQRVYV